MIAALCVDRGREPIHEPFTHVAYFGCGQATQPIEFLVCVVIVYFNDVRTE